MEEKLQGEKSVPKKKLATRKTRQERLNHAAQRERGKCIELLRPITQCTPADLGMADVDMPVKPHELDKITVEELCDRLNIKVSDLMFKLVDHTEGMCDLNDVKRVMIEGDIINGVIPARMNEMIKRIPTKTYTFK